MKTERGKKLKKSKKFSTTIKTEILEKLDKISKKKNYKKSTVIEIALGEIFKKWGKNVK